MHNASGNDQSKVKFLLENGTEVSLGKTFQEGFRTVFCFVIVLFGVLSSLIWSLGNEKAIYLLSITDL